MTQIPHIKKSVIVGSQPFLENSYSVKGHCLNCGHETRIQVERGRERPRVVDCPICNCPTMRSGW